MSAIEFDKLYSDRKPPKRVTTAKLGKVTQYERVKSHANMWDVYENKVLTKHIWMGHQGRWFEIPAGESGQVRELNASKYRWLLK
jgi:hypothetical protein